MRKKEHRSTKLFNYFASIEFYLENLSNIIYRESFDDMKKKRAQFTLAMCVNHEEMPTA